MGTTLERPGAGRETVDKLLPTIEHLQGLSECAVLIPLLEGLNKHENLLRKKALIDRLRIAGKGWDAFTQKMSPETIAKVSGFLEKFIAAEHNSREAVGYAESIIAEFKLKF